MNQQETKKSIIDSYKGTINEFSKIGLIKSSNPLTDKDALYIFSHWPDYNDFKDERQGKSHLSFNMKTQQFTPDNNLFKYGLFVWGELKK